VTLAGFAISLLLGMSIGFFLCAIITGSILRRRNLVDNRGEVIDLSIGTNAHRTLVLAGLTDPDGRLKG